MPPVNEKTPRESRAALRRGPGWNGRVSVMSWTRHGFRTRYGIECTRHVLDLPAELVQEMSDASTAIGSRGGLWGATASADRTGSCGRKPPDPDRIPGRLPDGPANRSNRRNLRSRSATSSWTSGVCETIRLMLRKNGVIVPTVFDRVAPEPGLTGTPVEVSSCSRPSLTVHVPLATVEVIRSTTGLTSTMRLSEMVASPATMVPGMVFARIRSPM